MLNVLEGSFSLRQSRDSPNQNTHTLSMFLTDVQQMVAIKEERDWSPTVDQQEAADLRYIQEEREKLWSSRQEAELTGVVKSEEDEEKPELPRLHQPAGVKPDVEPDAGWNSVKTSRSSGAESEDSWDWVDTTQRRPKKAPPEDDVEHSAGPATKFVCPVCGKTYPRKNSFKDHMRLHSEGKRFSCSVCKKRFQWRAGVVRHMRTHTGEKPFACYFCGLTFAQNSSLISHVRIHTGERPFKCSMCKARFRVSCHLSEHVRLHSAVKAFSCSHCGKRFAQRRGLRRHTTVHTGEKPFTCSVCDKTFTWHENLRRHLSAHARERPATGVESPTD